MESAKYYRLDQLPEPDYFEIELEKIYQPPPTRLERLQKCVRRYWKVVLLVVLFLVAAVLYAGLELGSRPRLIGIIRPENGQLKELAEVHAQATVTVEDSTVVTTNGDTVTVDVAGVDVNIGNATADTNTTTTTTTTDTNTAAGKPVLDLSDKNATSSEAGNIMAEGAAKNTTTTTTSGTPKPKPAMQQDDGQVSIHDAPPASNEPTMPIKATFYSGAEGPKACRGHVIAVVNMPKQQAAAAQDPAGTTTPAAPTAPACYNFPGEQASGCATFAANKADGCIAQVFAETNCRVFMNTAAFMAEDRPVGGNWRSVRVQCGIPEPDPATLGKPPMMDAITSLQDNDKAKGGGRA